MTPSAPPPRPSARPVRNNTVRTGAAFNASASQASTTSAKKFVPWHKLFGRGRGSLGSRGVEGGARADGVVANGSGARPRRRGAGRHEPGVPTGAGRARGRWAAVGLVDSPGRPGDADPFRDRESGGL